MFLFFWSGCVDPGKCMAFPVIDGWLWVQGPASDISGEWKRSKGIAISWDLAYLHGGQCFLLLKGPVILRLTWYLRQLGTWKLGALEATSPSTLSSYCSQPSREWILGRIWNQKFTPPHFSVLPSCVGIHWLTIWFEWSKKQIGFVFGIQNVHPFPPLLIICV